MVDMTLALVLLSLRSLSTGFAPLYLYKHGWTLIQPRGGIFKISVGTISLPCTLTNKSLLLTHLINSSSFIEEKVGKFSFG